MGFFKTKLSAPANGQLIPIEEVNDEVFASKMMGEGFAVIDHDGKVYAPITGTIENIFPTKHAITLTNKKRGADLDPYRDRYSRPKRRTVYAVREARRPSQAR